MTESIPMQIIARAESSFPTKFGIPRQSGLETELRTKIVFEKEFRTPDALRGIEQYSHLWVLWQFSEAVRDTWSATVRPPRLGGNRRVGVFATRSPFRPNPIGLSSVKLEGVEQDTKRGTVLIVSGADFMDGTPIFDIKPYLAYTDSHPEALQGFAGEGLLHTLTVDFPEMLLGKIPENERGGLLSVLKQDPRPSYQNDPDREYGFLFSAYEVKFTVDDDVLHVTTVEARTQ